MTTAQKPVVDCDHYRTSLYVSDVLAAVDFGPNKLGFDLGFTWGEPVTMAGVNLGKVQIFLHQGTPDPDGCMLSFAVGDADELYEFQRANGVEVVEPPADRDYGVHDYSVRDLYGH